MSTNRHTFQIRHSVDISGQVHVLAAYSHTVPGIHWPGFLMCDRRCGKEKNRILLDSDSYYQ